MGLLNKLQTQGSNLSNTNGATPTIPNFAGSTLHNLYSITGVPNMVNKPTPSVLDLNGVTPTQYLDNLPS